MSKREEQEVTVSGVIADMVVLVALVVASGLFFVAVCAALNGF